MVPSEQIIDIGRQARLECLTEDRDRSAITWMKDGQALPNHPRFVANRQTLQIFNLQTDDYGMYQCFVARGHQEAQASSELRLGGNSNACNFIFGRKGFSCCCVCVVSLLRLLVYFLSFCTKEWTGRPRDGSANYSACRPRSSASHSSCCSVWSFSDKLGRRKKMANQRQLEPNVVLSSLFIPYYFLVSFDKLSFFPLAFSRKKDPIDWLILSLEKKLCKKVV